MVFVGRGACLTTIDHHKRERERGGGRPRRSLCVPPCPQREGARGLFFYTGGLNSTCSGDVVWGFDSGNEVWGSGGAVFFLLLLLLILFFLFSRSSFLPHPPFPLSSSFWELSSKTSMQINAACIGGNGWGVWGLRRSGGKMEECLGVKVRPVVRVDCNLEE